MIKFMIKSQIKHLKDVENYASKFDKLNSWIVYGVGA